MKKIMASSWRYTYINNEPEADFEITFETAKRYYYNSNCELILKDELSFYLKNFSLDILMEWNNEFIIKKLNECNELLEILNYSIKSLKKICEIYIESIRDVPTNDREVLKKEYEFLISLFDKYGYCSLYEIWDPQYYEYTSLENFKPLWNDKIIYLNSYENSEFLSYPIFYKEYVYKLKEYGLSDNDNTMCFSYGLIPFAYYLKDYDLIDKIVKNILYPAIEHFLEPSELMEKEDRCYLLPPHHLAKIKDNFKYLNIDYKFDKEKIKDSAYFEQKSSEYMDYARNKKIGAYK